MDSWPNRIGVPALVEARERADFVANCLAIEPRQIVARWLARAASWLLSAAISMLD